MPKEKMVGNIMELNNPIEIIDHIATLPVVNEPINNKNIMKIAKIPRVMFGLKTHQIKHMTLILSELEIMHLVLQIKLLTYLMI